MDVIEDIRQSYRVDDEQPSALSNCAEQALELLSDQLYTTDTHFLLELVQNAEDNEYASLPGLVPTLRIVATYWTVTISCNEVGFSEHNVRAICKIGASTKKNISGYIGEKGIGFKSVFKVADVVHVASGPYKFKFDRKQRLGMIAPFWDTSGPSEPGWTTFHLKLSQPWNLQESPGTALGRKILEIKPSLLLFLKKLRSIEIEVNIRKGGRQRAFRIERKDLDSSFVQLTRSDNNILHTYFIVKHSVNMTSVPRSVRRGADRTELVLAFPVDKSRRPCMSPQDVHAFLPLRGFGFNFVIHGDFLTPSSREDILYDSPWNMGIRDGIVDAFLAAIPLFQAHDTLRDTWIRYLPTGLINSFFAPVETKLFSSLATMYIVKDAAGAHRLPSQVLNIPLAYRYEGGPLIDERFLEHYYISDCYNTSADLQVLKRLGIRDMTADDFLSGISNMQPTTFATFDSERYEAVCRELIRLFYRKRSGFNTRMHNVKIIPLDDGSWAPTREASKFVFEADVTGIPVHINFRRIHPRVRRSSMPQQYELLRALGVRDADPRLIGEKILEDKGMCSVQAAVANALFFFTHRHDPELPSPTGRLRVVDEKGNHHLGEELYLDLPDDNGILRRLLPSSALFIHRAYIHQFPNRKTAREEWMRWLVNSLRLNTAPRVVNTRLSPEFDEMTKRTSLRELLIALKYFWPRWTIRPNAQWLKALGQLSVVMDDGSRRTVNSLYLKRRAWAEYGGISFVPVDIPESRDWDFLSLIGVTMEADVASFLKLLIQYKTQGMNDEDKVKRIYKQLDARFDEDATQIINAFREHPLVYVDSETPFWTHLSNVYWDGPSTIISKIVLRTRYPGLEELFQDKLGLENAPPNILIEELKALADEWIDKPIMKDVHEKASDLILDISSFLVKGLLATSEVAPVVTQNAIFPARHPLTGVQLRKLKDIYIPDRAGRYADAFRDKVPLLELYDGVPVLKVQRLLRVADIALRSLDECVVQRMERRGTPKLNVELTAQYASKYHAFERVVHGDSGPTDRQLELLTKLKEMTISMADSISSTLTLPGHSPISMDSDLLQLVEEDSSMTIFISNAVYRSSEHSKRVHFDICERLSTIFACSLEEFLLCATLDTEMLSMLFQLKGVSVTNLCRVGDTSWVEPRARQASSSTSPSISSRSSSYNNAHTDIVSQLLTGNIGSQQDFSMKDTHEEVDRLLQDLPDFSTSSIRVVSPEQPGSRMARDISLLMSPSESEGPTLRRVNASTGVFSGVTQPKEIFSDIPDQSRSPISYTGTPSQPTVYQEVNGFLGECYVYNLLSEVLGPSFGPQNWTSELREFHPGYDRFCGQSLADFTYEDCDGTLTKLLYKENPDALENWKSGYPTYHIEVKSTSSGSHEPFQLSKRQLHTVTTILYPLFAVLLIIFLQALSLSSNNQQGNGRKHVYAIIRVWNVRSPTTSSHLIYPDPIECIANDKLKITSEKVELMVGV